MVVDDAEAEMVEEVADAVVPRRAQLVAGLEVDSKVVAAAALEAGAVAATVEDQSAVAVTVEGQMEVVNMAG
jgi:hypothetical protein